MRWGALALLCVLSTSASTIIPWKGTPISKVTVEAVQNGYLYYTHGDAREKGRVKLFDIKTIIESEAADDNADDGDEHPAEEGLAPTNKRAKIVSFDALPNRRRPARILKLGVLHRKARMQAPYVRVFVLVEDTDGQRKLRKFSNRKQDDPTRLAGVPEVNARAFRSKGYLAEVGSMISWRAEIWVDGELIESREELGKSKPGWWRDLPLERSITMHEMDPGGPVVTRERIAEGPQAKIRFARVAQKLGQEGMHLSYGFTVAADQKSAPVPTVTLYTLLADNNGMRELVTHTDSPASVQMVNGQGTIHSQVRLPPEVQLSRPAVDDTESRHLVFWRLELRYGERVASEFSSPDSRVARTLAENWWLKK